MFGNMFILLLMISAALATPQTDTAISTPQTDNELPFPRLVILGPTRAGKSTWGNYFLGCKRNCLFNTGRGSKPVTKVPENGVGKISNITAC